MRASRWAILLALLPLACQPPSTVPSQPPAKVQSAPARVPGPVLLQAEPIGVTPDLADDPDLEALIAPKAAEIRATFDLPLCSCPTGLFRSHGPEENLLGYWVTDVMRTRASQILGKPVKFALTNSGGLRANLAPGTVKVMDIYSLMPFENELVTLEMTGQDVMDAVRQGILHRGGEPCSGVKAAVTGTVEHPEYRITWEDGSPIDPAEGVTVATTDYLYGGGDSIPALKNGRHLFHSGLALRQILLDACGALAKAGQPLTPPKAGRYLISPEMQQAARDHRLGK